MSPLLRHTKERSIKTIARSLLREMNAHGYELHQMVGLLAEFMDLLICEHQRRAGRSALEEPGGERGAGAPQPK